jgi:hypothetical protein
VIHGGELRAICFSLPGVLDLRGHRRHAPFAGRRNFRSGRPDIKTPRTAVITNSAVRYTGRPVTIDICVRNHIRVDVVNAAIVGEIVTVPIAPVIASSHIPKTVIDTAIKSYVSSPKAAVPDVPVAIIFPPGRRPKRTHIRRDYPRPRNKVITCCRITPVARRPQIVIAGARRLVVFR